MTQRTNPCTIPATYMRGGTSKGVFFVAQDLPPAGPLRDRVLLRVLGSPDPYRQQIDGMGGATSSTSKVVILQRSTRADCDVDYLFGQVAVDQPLIDWSGNCGNLTAAVGPFALCSGLLQPGADGTQVVRIWQANIGKCIVAHVPVAGGAVVEDGGFVLDGVAFPAAEIALDFLEPAGGEGGLFPTGRLIDTLQVPGIGDVQATLIDAGNPTVVVAAAALSIAGHELPADLNQDAALLARCEAVRAHATVRMGLAPDAGTATRERPATPKIALVAAPAAYVTSGGRQLQADGCDALVRILSMGRLHHALTGTGGVALGVAASVQGTVMHGVTRAPAPGAPVRLGHASGVLPVWAEAAQQGGEWTVARVRVSRSARRLMRGEVFVPAAVFDKEIQDD